MKKEIKRAIFLLIFGVIGIYLLNSLGLLLTLLLVFFIPPILIYKIIKNRKVIKKNDIKKLVPYYIALPFFLGLDAISTYFFVFNEGPKNEANLFIRLLYSQIGNYTFLLMPFIASFIIILLSISFLKKGEGGIKANKSILKTIYIFCVLLFLFNLIL